MKPALIVVCGAPASGKTTLARRLAADLRLPLLEKDAIKESLARELPVPDREASRTIGRASTRLLWDLASRILGQGVDVMLECNFDRHFAYADLRRMDGHCRILIVQCEADPATIERRYLERAGRGEREAAHFDLEALPDLHTGLARGSYDLTDLGYDAVVVGTEDGYQPRYESVRERVRETQ